MNDMRIGVIDDDEKLVSLIVKYLKKNEFQSVEGVTPQKVLQFNPVPYDLLILDIMMPEINGLDLCRQIREKSNVPVIFLSAKDEVFDKVLGLEVGGDDYLTKPFEPRELLARIQSIFRRQKLEKGNVGESPVLKGRLEFQEMTIDLDRQLVELEKEEIEMTTHEFRLLAYLAENNGLILSRRQIQEYLENEDYFIYDRAVDVGISRVRKKIEKDSKSPKLLKTVWGRGYQLVLSRK